MSALAGIDQALWDIKGKVLNQPVHALLGGPVRQKMRVYSWIGGDRPADIVAGAKEVAARGFTAIKMLATEEMAWLDSNAKIDAVLARVQALREAMGPEFGIAVDFHGRLHRPMAKVLAKELDPFALMFIEEPVLSEHVEALREIANHTATPIALGERLFSRWDFKQVLTDGLVDIIQPDPSHAGGITETRKIAAMAEAYDVGAGAALSAGADRAGGVPATGCGLRQCGDPGTKPGHSLQQGQRSSGLCRQSLGLRLCRWPCGDSGRAGPGHRNQ